jgi:ATP-dependent DNA helicase DinG
VEPGNRIPRRRLPAELRAPAGGPSGTIADMNVADVLGPGGVVSRRLPNYEHRPEQLSMGERVEECIAAGRHLLVEAGTGVGKSFAYLVPAILAAASSSQKAVIATHTIALQEQLIEKDIPFLSGILPAEFSVVLAKGRRNYLCMRRLQATASEDRALFEFKSDVDELNRIADWSRETEEGTLQDLDFAPRSEVWSKVSAEAGACLGRRCEYKDRCHFQTARRRLQNANVVIANHALLFSDLALRADGANLLPDYDILILDEAHEVENTAADHLGLRITEGGVRYLLNQLVGRGGKGLLSAVEAGDEVKALVQSAKAEADIFFHAVREWAKYSAPRNLRVMKTDIVPDMLSEELAALSRRLQDEAEDCKKKDLEVEVTARAGQCDMLASSIRAFLAQNLEGQVYWVENDADGRRTGLHSAPVRVGKDLEEQLFKKTKSVILTSATLTIGSNHSFSFMRDRLGLIDAEEESLGSPFDFHRQATIHLPKRMPDPRSGQGFVEAVADEVTKAVFRSDGRAFVLFTSYKMLDKVYGLVRDEVEGRGYRLLRQGGGLPRTKLLKVFRDDVTSVLFGTDSFWQGVDVPGESLSHVIITKLPFEVPDRPLIEARTKDIDEQGGNSFMDYSLPRAVLRLKQGFGRLIRNHDDHGSVTILDPRVVTKRYGRIFIDSLPECEVVRE